MTDCNIEDEVEFEPEPHADNQKYDRAYNVLLASYAQNTDMIIINQTTEKTISSNSKEVVTFFKPGFAVHMNEKDAYQQYLKPASNEDLIIDKLSKVLYISRIGHHFIDQRSKFEFCLAGTTKTLKQFIQNK